MGGMHQGGWDIPILRSPWYHHPRQPDVPIPTASHRGGREARAGDVHLPPRPG